MNDLAKVKLFSLLSEPSQVTNQQMQSAYEEFVSQLTTHNQPEMNLTEAFRKLNFTRIEFDFLESLPFYGQGGGNALKKTYLKKTLTFIDSETELLHLKIRYPEQFRKSTLQTFKSDLYIIP